MFIINFNFTRQSGNLSFECIIPLPKEVVLQWTWGLYNGNFTSVNEVSNLSVLNWVLPISTFSFYEMSNTYSALAHQSAYFNRLPFSVYSLTD